jgi:KDO2-lipid IV(A) lauroyltransferase
MTTRLRDAFVYRAFAAGWATVRVLPEGFVRAVFAVIAEVMYRRGGRPVRRLRGNLARVLGPTATADQVNQVTREALHSYLRYWCEVFRLSSLSKEEIVGRITLQDEHYLRDAWAAGKGMILALPHMGNWDWAGAWLTHTGVPFTTVAERLKPERLFERFVAFRESIGMEVLPLHGGERPLREVLTERLRGGGCLCLLADRDLTAQGVPVRFFDGEAKMPGGPARLAAVTGAALLPVTIWYDHPRRVTARIHPPATGDVAQMTQYLADSFAEEIARHPADWHMLQRIWIDTEALARVAV